MRLTSIVLLGFALACSMVASGIAVASCSYDESSVLGSLEWCEPEGSLEVGGDYSASDVKARVIQIANNIIIAGSLLAIAMIIYSSILFIVSNGDDSQAGTAKKGILYSLLGFGLTLIAFPLVNALINFVFDL